jgi:branched-chain amino acid transport system ATP-binding protein
MTPLLSVRGLRAGYGGIPVLFHLDLDVGEGEIVALLGANGAGKTTTLRALSGMIPLMAGTVTLAGETVSGRPAQKLARLGIVHIPEGRGVFPSLEVDETLRLAAAMAGVPRRGVAGTLDEMYTTFPPLARRRGQAARHLSGGEQQMLALARGLIHRPRVLMIDEMSQGLAPTVVDSLFALVATLPERGVSLLLVEQFVSRALALASRAYVLEMGEVGYAGSAAALAADESFVRGSYLGDAGTPAGVGGSTG